MSPAKPISKHCRTEVPKVTKGTLGTLGTFCHLSIYPTVPIVTTYNYRESKRKKVSQSVTVCHSQSSKNTVLVRPAATRHESASQKVTAGRLLSGEPADKKPNDYAERSRECHGLSQPVTVGRKSYCDTHWNPLLVQRGPRAAQLLCLVFVGLPELYRIRPVVATLAPAVGHPHLAPVPSEAGQAFADPN